VPRIFQQAIHWLKSRLLIAGERSYRVQRGLFKGLTLNLDLHHQSQVMWGLWERETHSQVRSLLTGCHSAVDVGACAGEFTLLFLRSPGLHSVTAIEPYPPNLPRLDANLRLNGLDQDPRLTLHTQRLGSDTTDRLTLRLDDLTIPSDGPVFIKIDVDGGELDVLQSGPKLLQRPDVRLLVETHSVQLEHDCLSFLTTAGCHCQIIPNAWWRRFLPEDRPIGQNRWLSAVKRSA
jgi:hypothetical protein